MPSPELGDGHAAAGVLLASRRRGGVAARGARAAGRPHAAHRRAHDIAAGDPDAQARCRSISSKRCSNWAGPTAATCASISAGPQAMPTDIRKYAAELVALAPDVILATAARLWRHCYRQPALCRSCSRSSPIRSVPASSKAWRGRAATPPALCMFEYGLSGKWLELLKEIAPRVTRVAVLRDPAITAGIGQFAVIQSVAPSFGMEVSPLNLRDAAEIERAIAAFARSPNGGLIVTASALSISSSRSDHHARRPASTARGLPRSLIRHSRRSDLLWA